MSLELAERARALLASHRPAEASRLYLMLLQLPHASEPATEEWLSRLAECYRLLGRRTHLGYLDEYRGDFDRALEGFNAAGALPRQLMARGRLLQLKAKSVQTQAARSLNREAGNAYREAGLLVLAAIAFAAAGDRQSERQMWEQVLSASRLDNRLYERALVHFNLALTHRRDNDVKKARRHFVEAQQLLEEAADESEGSGQLDRSFDCYAVLVQIGKETQSYENLSEGFVNCIRILKRDNLKFFALQYYEDFLRLSVESKELYGAASLCREAADYCRRVGLQYDRTYVARSADLWVDCAKLNDAQKGPPEMSENALVAALDAFGTIGDFARIRETYEALSQLRGLNEKKRARYKQLIERYPKTGRPQSPPAPLPDYLRREHAYPAIWQLDLIEWELAGDPEPVCAFLVGDSRFPRETCQRALVALLLLRDAYEVAGADIRIEALPAATLSDLCQHLGEIRSYSVLAALERLFSSGGPAVRFAVMKACGTLYFKRTFALVARALGDDDSSVQKAALTTIAQLHFRHAFDPLQRLFHNHPEPHVREAVMTALGKIGSPEAVELLVEAVRHEPRPLRDVAFRLLEDVDAQMALPVLRRHAEVEQGPLRKDLEGLIRKLETRAR